MQDTFIHFRHKADVLTQCRILFRNEYRLDKILDEISGLIRGMVKPADTIRRSNAASAFTAITQQIGNYIDKENIDLGTDIETKLRKIAFKADKILRENIVLQSRAPLDVIRFKNVPVRHSYSSFGKREQRWGYGLHKFPFNEGGDSITVADMPAYYSQSIHNHTLSEYCLILDSKTEGIYYPGGIREKIYSSKKHELLHFSATTPHTLKNPSKNNTRNITFKQATGLIDWRPISHLNIVKIIRARLIKGRLSKLGFHQTMKKFPILDKYYNYSLEIIKLGKGTVYSAVHPYDQYIFVINGNLEITHKNIKKICKKNDFIVIDKKTDYKIMASTICRLYTVKT